VTVRLLCTQGPTPKEYGSWAWAPTSETGLLFLAAEMERRTTVGGGSPVVVRLFCTRRPTPKEYDSLAQAPVSETGPLSSAELETRTTAGGGLLFT
jgi:hypothetical protein